MRHVDELSPIGPTAIAEFYQEHALSTSTLRHDSFPIQPAKLKDLRGGDRQVNADIIRGILGGTDRGPRRDAVLLNASAALFVAGNVRSMVDGWDRAEKVIDSGMAKAKLRQLSGR